MKMNGETRVTGTVEPTKHQLSYPTAGSGRGIRATFYDRDGRKLGHELAHVPDGLAPGEKGEFTLRLPRPANEIGKMVFDAY